MMIDKLKKIKDRYDELASLTIKPEIINDQNLYRDYMKEYSTLTPICEAYERYQKLHNDLESAQEMLKGETDPEMIEMCKLEIESCKENIKAMDEEIKILLLPKDENDDKNVIMEIRGGAGGEESSLFAADLFRMYKMYADKMGWKVELTDINETELGGIKEATFVIKGKDVYSKLKYESGVHRVQRVPETESSGRIHTSTSTVAVLPERTDVHVEILDKDIKIDTYRASGAGGQHINKTDSAIRITHFPSGIVVTCQDGRSQIQNKERAFEILRSKLYDKYQQEADQAYAANRKNQVGSGDRSERIRTYNYPQSRMTDHRIGYTNYNLENFMNGNIEELIEALQIADQKAKLENGAMDD